MSEQARFQEWWESTGTNSVILRAQAWSAWLAAIRTIEQTAPDPHIALMEAEHDDRMQPPPEDPDEWVILDPVKYADHVLRWNIDFTNTRTGWEPITIWAGDTISDILNDYECTNVVFRCRRRDLPKVEQDEQAKQCISHDEHRGEWRCKNAALPGKDYCSECADEPQPQKTRVRLWKNAYGSVMSNPDCENIEGWQEIRVDSEGFYVEGGQS